METGLQGCVCERERHREKQLECIKERGTADHKQERETVARVPDRETETERERLQAAGPSSIGPGTPPPPPRPGRAVSATTRDGSTIGIQLLYPKRSSNDRKRLSSQQLVPD